MKPVPEVLEHGKLERRQFDVGQIRRDFPILAQTVHGRPLAYLDNAASAQKPKAVIAAVEECYSDYYANVHRGLHMLSERATAEYEGAREKVKRFLKASSPREIVFVRGTTEAINLVAHSYARPRLGPGDEVLITGLEHHSNIVPWQIVCAETGARLRVAAINDRGEVRWDEYERLLGERTRLVALVYVSNALGTVNPVREMIELAHSRGVPVLVDGAQAVPHLPVDVASLHCDFFACSGHKVFGPSGIGVLYGKLGLLEEMAPYQGGGEMIRKVTFDKTEYNVVPHKFEAGTPNIAGAIGLGVAFDYLEKTGMETVRAYEKELLAHATEAVGSLPGVRLVGTARHKASVLSFLVGDVHAHDVGTILDQEGIAVRAGHHCAQPVMDFFGIPATVRASFALYNTHEEVDRLVHGIERVGKIFG